ncbi:uncharacterized protein FOMMEDRAFT_136591 [Fomitiporia mediterranea MF3/22]|uniref:uncharacterized protein n=1 Tax=Fomitiporia mediterranea (strain MF3/22) TaxID=694068 RepID=UPI00044089A1|nr:uncharacterized protein FOMMEDRAFT_136591 [Fomitiporia mediterranea MF3/22]EJC99243.1 hypothetical protein FOMMEDRAFT_136591 [Fomitiporia mediterranea MF3/22]
MGCKHLGLGDEDCFNIFDQDPQIQYNGQWVLNQFTDQGAQSSHSTGQNGSSISVPFYGNQIKVSGIIPTGQGQLVANYSIDDGPPSTSQLSVISQSTPLLFQQFFMSPNLTLDNHTITITVLQTGFDRNYTFEMFTVWPDTMDDSTSDKSTQQGASDNGSQQDTDGTGRGKNTAAIVGGVLGTVIFLSLCLLGVFYFWKRRRLAKMSSDGQQRLPPMMYYTRPLSERDFQEKADYTAEASVIDTDSKFTFTRHKGGSTNHTRSWVSVNMPPSVPQSAVINNHVSGWSSYKGSSVIVEQPQVERSHFSPYTATTFSPSGFREHKPLPGTRRSAGVPPRIETLTTSSESLGPYENRRL